MSDWDDVLCTYVSKRKKDCRNIFGTTETNVDAFNGFFLSMDKTGLPKECTDFFTLCQIQYELEIELDGKCVYTFPSRVASTFQLLSKDPRVSVVERLRFLGTRVPIPEWRRTIFDSRTRHDWLSFPNSSHHVRFPCRVEYAQHHDRFHIDVLARNHEEYNYHLDAESETIPFDVSLACKEKVLTIDIMAKTNMVRVPWFRAMLSPMGSFLMDVADYKCNVPPTMTMTGIQLMQDRLLRCMHEDTTIHHTSDVHISTLSRRYIALRSLECNVTSYLIFVARRYQMYMVLLKDCLPSTLDDILPLLLRYAPLESCVTTTKNRFYLGVF